MDRWKHFSQSFLQLIIFLIPTQLGYHFWPNWSHLFGVRVDYFSPTIYLTDILIFAFVALRMSSARFDRMKTLSKIALPVILFVLINISLAINQPVAIYKWLRAGEFALFALATLTFTKEDLKRLLFKPLLFSLALISVVAFGQFVLGHSLGGLFYFLGERSFSLTTPGIALTRIDGAVFLRAYSTFPHPNAMAGYFLLATALLFWSDSQRILRSIWARVILVFCGMAFLLTFSSGGFITAAVVTAFLLITPKRFIQKIPLLLLMIILVSFLAMALGGPILKNFRAVPESVSQRIELDVVAGKIFSSYPIIGSGPGGFISLLPQYGETPAVSWWLQPVHNIYLLVLTETGLVGIILFFLLLVWASHRAAANLPLAVGFIIIIITGALDHYWLTLQQNQILFSLLLTLSFL